MVDTEHTDADRVAARRHPDEIGSGARRPVSWYFESGWGVAPVPIGIEAGAELVECAQDLGVAAQQPRDEHGEEQHDDCEQEHQDAHGEDCGTGPRQGWGRRKPCPERISDPAGRDGWPSSRTVRTTMDGRGERPTWRLRCRSVARAARGGRWRRRGGSRSSSLA
jgi:hypothetical protein